MRTPGPESRKLWEDICRVLIEAGEPLATEMICARVHERMPKVYYRLLQLEERGVIAANRSRELRSVYWTYTGEDIARQAKPVDLDAVT